ncbi:MAG: hypothetical protein ABF449_02885 [Ethanoligenens sp.]
MQRTNKKITLRGLFWMGRYYDSSEILMHFGEKVILSVGVETKVFTAHGEYICTI